MLVAVVGNRQMLEESGLVNGEGVEVLDVPALTDISASPDAIFFLEQEEQLADAISELSSFNCLVIVNSVVGTLRDLPEHFCRINGWPGFLARPVWEVAAKEVDVEELAELFLHLDKKIAFVADQPGMIAARTISMIINEAFFALQDGVSTREEIDMAMKLGTNYPLGPFEWCNKIGVHRISSLLECLASTSSIYHPAPNLL